MTQKIRQRRFKKISAAYFFALSMAFSAEIVADDFSHEPPVIGEMLAKASILEADNSDLDAEWKAASLYCEAARIGSPEAQYRLGMLYAFGKGVPQNRAWAASLFSNASLQGHAEAMQMLETIQYSTTELPPCVTENVAPEKAPNQYAYNESGVATNIDYYIKGLPKNKRWVVDLVSTLSEWYNVDARLILSIIATESNFKIAAQSNKSAMGLMQLIPETAERFNVKNAFNATQNIKGGISYVRWLLAYYRGDVKLAVAAYNAGEGAVDRNKGVPPYKETRAYVKKVMGFYQRTKHPYDSKVSSASPLIKQ